MVGDVFLGSLTIGADDEPEPEDEGPEPAEWSEYVGEMGPLSIDG